METKNNRETITLGTLSIIFSFILAVLKLVGTISITWFQVFLPMIISTVIGITLALIILLVVGIKAVINRDWQTTKKMIS